MQLASLVASYLLKPHLTGSRKDPTRFSALDVLSLELSALSYQEVLSVSLCPCVCVYGQLLVLLPTPQGLRVYLLPCW